MLFLIYLTLNKTGFMFEVGEIIDLIVSIILTFYLVALIRKDLKLIKTYWFWGILSILLSKLISVIEVLFIPNLLNYIEHISFLVASILFLISIYRKEL